MSLLELYVEVDDFQKRFEQWLSQEQIDNGNKPGPKSELSSSEIMTIVIHFHQANYRNFKHYYQKHVCEYLRGDFPSW